MAVVTSKAVDVCLEGVDVCKHSSIVEWWVWVCVRGGERGLIGVYIMGFMCCQHTSNDSRPRFAGAGPPGF